MIDINKKYRTRDGRGVRIYATDGAGIYCVQGAVENSIGWEIKLWKSCGSVFRQSRSYTDLVEVVMLPEYWVVFYDCDYHPRITQCEPTPRDNWTIIHHPAQEKPVT
jgi:hypothetical protein